MCRMTPRGKHLGKTMTSVLTFSSIPSRPVRPGPGRRGLNPTCIVISRGPSQYRVQQTGVAIKLMLLRK